MNLNDLNSLDLKNIGDAPLPVKALLVAVVCVVVLAAGYYLDLTDQQDALDKKKAQVTSLITDFDTKQAKAASLEAYQAQMIEMEDAFGTMLRQLPNKNEIANLLVDITQTGLASGLEFELFQPNPEVPREFFAELPITIKVTGTYHQVGEFVSGIAALPRIVTLHDMSAAPLKTGTLAAASDRLQVQATAKTYRYLDEEELAAAAASRAKEKMAGKGAMK
ncbi:MAG TPA: type 4a pilus biogenesis protein PilO [Gammaproteobacteria bacterium]